MRLPRSGKVFVVCGLWLIALGVYFLVLRPALLPEDARFVGSSPGSALGKLFVLGEPVVKFPDLLLLVHTALRP